MRLTGQRVKAWERRAILAMDRAYIAAWSARTEAERGGEDGEGTGEPLTVELFDRMFG